MKHRQRWIILLGIIGVTNCWTPLISAGTVTESGSDAFNFAGWNLSPIPDLVSASATFDATYLYLSVRITPGFPAIDSVANKGTTYIGFYLDTDQNPATGGTLTNPATDTTIIGYEKRVSFSTGSTQAFLSDYLFAGLGSFPATKLADGFDVALPLSALGDDGFLNFKVHDYVQLSSSSTTVILDTLPDVGLAAGTSTFVPEPASLSCAALVAMSSVFMRRKRGPRFAATNSMLS